MTCLPVLLFTSWMFPNASLILQVVRDVLNQTLPGKILLSKQFLEEPDRNRLSEVIVNHYLLLSRGEYVLSRNVRSNLIATIVPF